MQIIFETPMAINWDIPEDVFVYDEAIDLLNKMVESAKGRYKAAWSYLSKNYRVKHLICIGYHAKYFRPEEFTAETILEYLRKEEHRAIGGIYFHTIIEEMPTERWILRSEEITVEEITKDKLLLRSGYLLEFVYTKELFKGSNKLIWLCQYLRRRL